MFCAHCGTRLDGADVCPACGTLAPWSSEVDITTGGSSPLPAGAPRSPASRTRVLVCLAVAAAVVVVGGVIGWQQRDTGSPEPVAAGATSTPRPTPTPAPTPSPRATAVPLDEDGADGDLPGDWRDEDWGSEFEEFDDYGDSPLLDALWDDCDTGDDDACRELYWSTPYGSEYERFGSTCGDRDPEEESCGTGSDEYGYLDAQDYGDDPELDALWDDCDTGDDDACRELYWEAGVDTGYERFAETCGGRDPSAERCIDGGDLSFWDLAFG